MSFNVNRIYYPPVLVSLLSTLAYVAFLIVVKYYNKVDEIFGCIATFVKTFVKDENVQQRIDWQSCIAKAAASSMMGLVIFIIIINNKKVEVFDWPPTSYFVLEAVMMVIPFNWIILSSSLR